MASLAQRLGFGPTKPAAAPPTLTAAAHVLRLGRDKITPKVGDWQDEAWQYYGRLGEYMEGVDWLARALSRVRLVPAVQKAGTDEPEPVDSGPLVDLLGELAGGTDGQSQMLGTLSTLFTVAGEAWLTGESTDAGVEWVIRSASEIREGKTKNARGEAIPEVIDDASATANRLRWRPLAPLDGDDWFIAKLWARDKQYRHLPSSPSKAALPDLRRLELVNRRIDADLLSRLVMNGLLLLPNEVTFPIRPEFEDEPDPFVAMLLEIAREAIATPGTAAAAIPIPLKAPGEWLKEIRHLTFASPIDERLLDLRLAIIRSAATTLNMPAEKLTGIGDLNHWTLSQMDEDGVKENIAPHAQLLVHSINRGFTWPMLGGPSENVLWFDLSELVGDPDRSEAARDAFDRGELSPKSYRIHGGFDEADEPTDQERQQMALWKLLDTAEAGRAAEKMNVLEPVPVPEPLAPSGPRPVDDKTPEVGGTPATRDTPAPSGREAPARAASANGRAT